MLLLEINVQGFNHLAEELLPPLQNNFSNSALYEIVLHFHYFHPITSSWSVNKAFIFVADFLGKLAGVSPHF